MLKITGRHNKYETSEEFSELLTDWTLRLNEDSVIPSQKREEDEGEAGLRGEEQRGLQDDSVEGDGLGDYDGLVERGVVGEFEMPK